MFIKKKILTKYYNDILCGKKKYEIRLNDFNIKKGDYLILEEYNSKTKKYSGRKITKKVIKVDKFKNLFWSEKEIKDKGIQIILLD